MTRLLKRLWPEEEAQSLSEYALLLFLISLTAVTAMGSLATRISTAYTTASAHVAAASHDGSLSGNSLGLGTQTQADKPYPFKDGDALNPNQAAMPQGTSR